MNVDVLVDVEHEMERAQARYGPFQSTHEGLGVLTEEVAELLEAIRSNDLAAVAGEAIQVAAVAVRIVYSLADEDTRERSVK